MKYKYKATVRQPDGQLLENVIIDSDEDYARLMAHAHIHSAVPVEEEKPVTKKTKE